MFNVEAAGKILVDRKQEKQSGKCFNCADICHAVLQQKTAVHFLNQKIDPDIAAITALYRKTSGMMPTKHPAYKLCRNYPPGDWWSFHG